MCISASTRRLADVDTRCLLCTFMALVAIHAENGQDHQQQGLSKRPKAHHCRFLMNFGRGAHGTPDPWQQCTGRRYLDVRCQLDSGCGAELFIKNFPIMTTTTMNSACTCGVQVIRAE